MHQVQRVLFKAALIRYPKGNDLSKGRTMRKTLPLLLCATLAVTGCARVSDSKLNPLNWFGASRSAPLNATDELRPLVPANRETKVVDSRGAIETVATLSVEKTPDGALIRATGIASTQGQFNAQLVPVSNEGGTLTLAFRIQAAAGSTGVNDARSREVTVARFLSFDELSDVKTIVVQGATNARSTSR